MDFETFIENFDAIAEAPGGIPKLRVLILELAVRGKLVPQSLEDEPAEKLLKRIKAEKELLVKEKRIKKEDPLPEIAENEISYDLPKGWALSRLGNLFEIVRGSSPRPKGDPRYFATQKTDFHWIKISDITAYTKNNQLINTEEYLTEEGTKLSRKVGKNDIIIAASGSVGKACLLGIEGFIYDGLMAVRGINSDNLRFYLLCFFKTIELSLLGGATGTSWKNINTDILKNTVIPLPPEEEQYRILAKVDELMGLCDRYEAAKQTRDNLRQKLRESAIASLMDAETDEELDAAWAIVRDNWQNLSQHPQDVSDLRQAVLQLAVRGKLVPQNFEDEPASVLLEKVEAEKRHLIKEKKLKERWNPVPVSPDAIPYKIPVNWKWIRILDGVERVTVGHVGSMQNEYVPEGVPFLRSQNVRENRFDPLGLKFISQEFHDKLAKSKLSPRDVVVVRSGNVGTTCVIPEELEDANCSDLVIVKRPMAIDSGFLSYYMNSAAKSHVKEGTVGIALTHFNTESVASLPIPLPPLAEQKRIVAKVDELMQLCDQLEASLHLSQQRAESLAASAISHLTI